MDVYKAEEQQIEDIKRWWRENGMSLVIGITLGISAIFGWRHWQAYKTEQAESASVLYSDMVASLRAESKTEVEDSAHKILEKYENTAYGVFAKLALAKLAVTDNELAAAEMYLREALDKNINDSFSHVIRLRLIRVLISQNKFDEADSLIAIPEKGEFAASYDELLGDVEAALGKFEAARSAYQQSINKARDSGRDISAIELKIDNIGH